MNCPNCGSDRTRRGGKVLWTVYLVLIAAAIVAVLHFHLHAGLVGGIMIAAVVLAHLIYPQRVCLECGHQWRFRQ